MIWPKSIGFRTVGVKLIEAETAGEIRQAIGNNTAAIAMVLSHNSLGHKVELEELISIAHGAGLPVILDAAAELPPAENLSKFVKMGADLVAFSGGKGLRGPQCSGLLLGRKDLVEAAYLNGSPHSDSIGRGCKVGKEEIIAMLTALESFLKRDYQAETEEWERRATHIIETVTKVPGVEAEKYIPEIANQVPHVKLQWDPAKVKLTKREVVQALRDGNPRIELRPDGE